MRDKEIFTPRPKEWGKMSWKETPYQGVFIANISEQRSKISKIPDISIFAVKIDPNCLIPPHRHNRKNRWKETIVILEGGEFEITDIDGPKKFSLQHQFSKTIQTRQVFGIKNLSPNKPLHLRSIMTPGFTGYAEIEELEETTKK